MGTAPSHAKLEPVREIVADERGKHTGHNQSRKKPNKSPGVRVLCFADQEYKNQARIGNHTPGTCDCQPSGLPMLAQIPVDREIYEREYSPNDGGRHHIAHSVKTA